LLAGVRPEDLEALGKALGLSPETSEPVLAGTLVRRMVELQVAELALGGSEAVPSQGESSRVVDGRASFLIRLGGPGRASVDLERLDDVRTLVAVLRAGNIAHQRAAVLRIGELLARGGLSAEPTKLAIDALTRLRAGSVAYEVWHVLSRLSGAEGRRVRAGGERWDALHSAFEAAVKELWDGAAVPEPASELEPEPRVLLFARVRDFSEIGVAHLCAVIEGTDGVLDKRGRAMVIAALRDAGDPRLVPALRAALATGDEDLVVPAARALARIDDPRVHGLLRAAFEHTAPAAPRLVLAASLALAGDRRGLPYARQVLGSGDERLFPRALQVLAEAGESDDVQPVIDLLERHDKNRVLVVAVQTLGRIGDSRALTALTALRARGLSSGTRAEIEDAINAISARMELLGEAPPPERLAAHALDTARIAAIVRRRDPAGVRLRAHVARLLGHLWLLLGVRTRAIARLETASALRPDWVPPLLQIAITYARAGETPQALAGFRRALTIDRSSVEHHPTAVRWLAQSFLRRSDSMAQDGRDDIARGLLEEALALDLRRAPSELRVALEHRLQGLARPPEVEPGETAR
jgi:HEAT repeat protein